MTLNIKTQMMYWEWTMALIRTNNQMVNDGNTIFDA